MARPVAKQTSSAKATPTAKPKAKPKLTTKKATAKATPAARKATSRPAARKATPAARKITPTATKTAPAARAAASSPTRAAKTAAAPSAPAPARFTFTAVPIVRDAAGLTPLLRAQLVVDAQVRTGRTTTPDRIPTSYFSPGVVRWRVAERGKPMFDVVHDTAFFPDSAEPVGLERIAGHWRATGRGSDRGRALDLPRLAWELMRDWPGRRLALDPEPRPGAAWTPLPPTPDAPWPPDATFV